MENNTTGLMALLVEIVPTAVVVNLQAACTQRAVHVQRAEAVPQGVV